MDKDIEILLVEDNPGDADLLMDLLAGEQKPAFSILHVQRLSEALAENSRKTFDVILLDLGLPDSQRMDTLLSVRRQSAKIPIIILTGLADKEFAIEAIKTGADDYLQKGEFSEDLLVRTIRYAIERKRVEEALRESEERFRRAVDEAAYPLMIHAEDGQVLQVNKIWTELTGYAIEQIPTVSAWAEKGFGERKEQVKEYIDKLYRLNTRIHDGEFTVTTNTGDKRIWDFSSAPLGRLADGRRLVISMAYDVTERKQAEERIAHLASFPESNPNAIIETDLAGGITYANPAVMDRFPQMVQKGLGHPLLRGWKAIVQAMQKSGKTTYWRELEVEGTWFDQLFFYSEDGKYYRIHSYDVGERKRAERALRDSEERYRVITESAQDAIFTIDENSTILFVNPAAHRIFGYSLSEMKGKSLTMLMPERFQKAHVEAVRQVAASGKRNMTAGSVEFPGLHRDGREIPLEISYGEFKRDEKHFFTGIVRDVTERKRAEETIRYQTYHDLLTGLPNRAQLMVKLKLELAQAARNSTRLAIVHLDLDRFKVINDTLGHAIGDRVILAVAERLGNVVRKSDTLSRVGSDEFLILLADLKTPEDAARVAVQIVNGMRKLFTIDNKDLYVTASIGISMFPDDSTEPEVLLSNADIAVSHVKETGRNNYQFFNPSINIRTLERLLLESSLRQTIERNQLELYYQPQVNIRTGEVICLEALVRWNHPDLGLLLPAQFIPIAEEIGFITAIDEWVLRTACVQNKAWQENGRRRICVTVNISSQQFQHPDLIRMVQSIVAGSGLDPTYLDIEVTESTAMRDIDLAIPNLRRLNDLGINLSIDDFGTGYSSLNYLKRFPVQTLKIDQSFIRGIASDADDQAIVKAVIAMGHNLRLKVLAEGVETPEQLSFLRDSECDEMQGFLFSEPMPAPQIEEKFSFAR